LKKLLLGDVKNLISEVRNSVNGTLYEQLIRSYFLQTDRKYNIRCLETSSSDSSSLLEVPNLSSSSSIVFHNLATYLKDNPNPSSPCLCVPDVNNYPAVDFLVNGISNQTIFGLQVTVAKQHPILLFRIAQIIQELKNAKMLKGERFKFFFVVPESRFRNFKKQKFCLPKREIWDPEKTYHDGKFSENARCKLSFGEAKDLVKDVEQWVVEYPVNDVLVNASKKRKLDSV
jgi:hypothetical protein